jgi:hypothetical protein
MWQIRNEYGMQLLPLFQDMLKEKLHVHRNFYFFACIVQTICCDSGLGVGEHKVKMSCFWRGISVYWYIATTSRATISFKQEGNLYVNVCLPALLVTMAVLVNTCSYLSYCIYPYMTKLMYFKTFPRSSLSYNGEELIFLNPILFAICPSTFSKLCKNLCNGM